MNPILVEVMRGRHVESQHSGALAVVDADGAVVVSCGDIDHPVFPRSAVKLLQALPLVESGAADRLQLSNAELALACASHNGEPVHVSTAAGMLAKAGANSDVLECGVHWPKLESTQRELAANGQMPGPLHNNCSGKHAGFICVACQLAVQGGAADLRRYAKGYVGADHPVMREVAAALAQTTGCDLALAPVATDGCSIPAYAFPLRALALAFARIGTGTGLEAQRGHAAKRLRRAIAEEPFMVAGTQRFDTLLMQLLGERACVKVGAEGVYCAALPGRGLGVAIKIDDGTSARAAEVVMAAVIEAFVALSDDEAAFMHGCSNRVLSNWRGIEVGALRATDALRRSLSSQAAP